MTKQVINVRVYAWIIQYVATVVIARLLQHHLRGFHLPEIYELTGIKGAANKETGLLFRRSSEKYIVTFFLFLCDCQPPCIPARY